MKTKEAASGREKALCSIAKISHEQPGNHQLAPGAYRRLPEDCLVVRRIRDCRYCGSLGCDHGLECTPAHRALRLIFRSIRYRVLTLIGCLFFQSLCTLDFIRPDAHIAGF